jgi:hypothetical protein
VRDFLIVALTLIAAGWSAEHGRMMWTALSITSVAATLALASWNERKVIGEAWQTLRREVSRYSARLQKPSRSTS